jgi:hypothetical protein
MAPVPKKVTLEVWRRLMYGEGEGAPCMHTLRSWIRRGLIQPPPQKEGRSYFLSPDARYVDPTMPTATLMERLNATAPRRS